MQFNPTLRFQIKKAISDVQLVGLQNRMTNVHAAIGIEQMKKIEQILTKKKKLAKNYNRLFKNNSNIKIPNSDFNNIVPFIYYIRVKKQYRDNLRKFLRKKNILTGLHWTPNHIYSLFKKDRKGSMQITNNVARELISLPYYTNLKYSQQVKVCDFINVFFKKKNCKIMNIIIICTDHKRNQVALEYFAKISFVKIIKIYVVKKKSQKS